MERRTFSERDDSVITTDSESDQYWNASCHDSFSFDEASSTAKPNAFISTKEKKVMDQMKKKNIPQLDMLKYDELDDFQAIEKAGEMLSFDSLEGAEEKLLHKSQNILNFQYKINSEIEKSSVSQTIQCILLGLDYTLEQFKGKKEKIQLLEEAVKSHDGNTILTIVLFLKNTLKTSIFHREMKNFPSAMTTYLSYLHKSHKKEELLDLFLLLNMPEEAAISHYETALAQKWDRRVNWVENSLATHFESGVVPRFYKESVYEHKCLLQDEMQLKANLPSYDPERCAQKLFQKLSGRNRITDSSVVFLLSFYLLLALTGHAKEASLLSVCNSIKSHYKVSEKQFLWCRLRTGATAGHWKQLNEIFLQKKWFGLKMPSIIRLEKVIDVLSERNAPIEVMKTFISSLENQDMKLNYAKKYQCHSLVIEILKKRKDREGLAEYKKLIPPYSAEIYAIENF